MRVVSLHPAPQFPCRRAEQPPAPCWSRPRESRAPRAATARGSLPVLSYDVDDQADVVAGAASGVRLAVPSTMQSWKWRSSRKVGTLPVHRGLGAVGGAVRVGALDLQGLLEVPQVG